MFRPRLSLDSLSEDCGTICVSDDTQTNDACDNCDYGFGDGNPIKNQITEALLEISTLDKNSTVYLVSKTGAALTSFLDAGSICIDSHTLGITSGDDCKQAFQDRVYNIDYILFFVQTGLTLEWVKGSTLVKSNVDIKGKIIKIGAEWYRIKSTKLIAGIRNHTVEKAVIQGTGTYAFNVVVGGLGNLKVGVSCGIDKAITREIGYLANSLLGMACEDCDTIFSIKSKTQALTEATLILESAEDDMACGNFQSADKKFKFLANRFTKDCILTNPITISNKLCGCEAVSGYVAPMY